jgi:hypothetical protein
MRVCKQLLALEHFNWELFDHPPNSTDLARSECHLFAYVENWYGSQRFNNSEELMEGYQPVAEVTADTSFTQAYRNFFIDTFHFQR